MNSFSMVYIFINVKFFLERAKLIKVKLSLNCFQSRLVFKTVREINPEYRSSLYSVVYQLLRSNASL